MTNWEYKHIRLDYKGRGITQEINLLDIDGERIRGWGSSNEVPTLPEMFEALGKDGWEMVTHVVNQDLQTNGTTFHYYNFKRPIQDMSEFDKLMKGGSKRKDVENRQIKRAKRRQTILWTLGISFVFTIIPPFIGIIVFVPTLLFALFYAAREWMG